MLESIPKKYADRIGRISANSENRIAVQLKPGWSIKPSVHEFVEDDIVNVIATMHRYSFPCSCSFCASKGLYL